MTIQEILKNSNTVLFTRKDFGHKIEIIGNDLPEHNVYIRADYGRCFLTQGQKISYYDVYQRRSFLPRWLGRYSTTDQGQTYIAYRALGNKQYAQENFTAADGEAILAFIAGK